MYNLPQSVLTHIYEYDPTYRVTEHRTHMTALKQPRTTRMFDISMHCVCFFHILSGIPLDFMVLYLYVFGVFLNAMCGHKVF